MRLALHNAIFSDFYESVTNGRTNGRTDGPTDQQTDGQGLLQRCGRIYKTLNKWDKWIQNSKRTSHSIPEEIRPNWHEKVEKKWWFCSTDRIDCFAALECWKYEFKSLTFSVMYSLVLIVIVSKDVIVAEVLWHCSCLSNISKVYAYGYLPSLHRDRWIVIWAHYSQQEILFIS